MATTSGTVSQYPFNQRKVLEHAFRRAGLMPEMASGENVEIAQDLLYLQLSEMVSVQFPLWTREFILLGPIIGSPDVACPVGTVDVFHTYWRTINPYRGDATDTNGNDQAVLFAGQPNADVTITGPNPGVIVNFGGVIEVDTVGILFGTTSPTVTTAIQIYTSSDGVTYTLAQTLASTTYTPGQWSYVDLDSAIFAQYVKLIYPTAGSWVLNQLNYGLANGTDIEIGPLNIDDYWNLPNKQFQSDRANSSYVDRQITAPVIKIWPTISTQGFYNGCISTLIRRYIQDPGSMTNNIEVPTRGFEMVVSRLATRLIREIPDADQSAPTSYFGLMAKQQRIDMLEKDAVKAEMLFWAEERTRAPIRLMPDISCYTR